MRAERQKYLSPWKIYASIYLVKIYYTSKVASSYKKLPKPVKLEAEKMDFFCKNTQELK